LIKPKNWAARLLRSTKTCVGLQKSVALKLPEFKKGSAWYAYRAVILRF